MRIAIASAVALSSFLGVHAAYASEGSATEPSTSASPTGLELGVRTGYALPMGQATGSSSVTVNGTTLTTQGQDLSNVVDGQLPFWLDVGYRLSPALYLGGFVQFAVIFPHSTQNNGCGQNGVSCGGNDIHAGIDLHYHFLPKTSFDPWAGVGVGYEWLNMNASSGGQSAGEQVVGWQFVNFQLGGDYKISPNLGIGPFMMLSLGQYDSYSFSGAAQSQPGGDIPSKALHEWLTFGVRGTYDINLGGGSSSGTARLVL
jgi:hypothetical protein